MRSSRRRHTALISFLTAAVIIAAARAEHTSPAADIKRLEATVGALPQGNPDQNRKKIVLQIALEQASSYLDAGNAERAAELCSDVNASLAKTIGREVSQQSFFLPFTHERDVLTSFDLGVAASLARREAPLPVPVPGKSSFRNINELRANGDQIFKNLVATAHPESKYHGNPELFGRAVRRTFNYIDSLDLSKDANMGEFFAMDRNLFAIYCLAKVYPEVLLPSQRKHLDQGLRMQCSNLMDAFGKKQLFNWCNANVSYASGLIHGGLLIGDSRYVQTGKAVMDHHVATQFPDGGFPYVTGQNESEGYHSIMPAVFNRIWLTTRDATALKGIVQGRNYTPLSIEPPIVGTYWTAPAWKWTWNSSYATSLEEAFHTRSPWLKTYQLVRRSYDRGRKPSDFNPYEVMLDLAGIQGAPLPNGYTVFDANIQGPRARYGNFSYAVVGREVKEPVGLQTFAGCMTVDNFDPKRPLPLNAAASGVFAGPKIKTSNDFTATAQLADSPTNTVMMGHDCAALTTTHSLSGQVAGPRKKPTSWRGNQQWVLLPDRIIGMVTVIPGKEPACEVTGRVKLVHGGTGTMYPKEIRILGPSDYGYGTLKVKIHSHNYGTVDVERNTSTLREGRNTATDIRLTDPLSKDQGNASLRGYSNPLYFIVEIFPESTTANATVEKIESGDLRGIKVTVNGRRLVSLMNCGKTPAAIQTSSYALPGVPVHVISGFQYQGTNIPSAPATFPIEPGKGILIVSGGKHDATPPWPSFTAMMDAFSKGKTDISNFPLPGL
jgi:hypothetical protein